MQQENEEVQCLGPRLQKYGHDAIFGTTLLHHDWLRDTEGRYAFSGRRQADRGAHAAADANNVLTAAAALDHRLVSGRHGE